ncbi:Flagellar motor protein [Hahella chejuensis KCTC 2396]|uniref:Flagellar motor protein n=1 Tax=Hahella chejuensis (strain KCTC 2396) TaxID=349521 RepID=Q2SQW3_HAHCH|nr:flagellar motor protein MotB [Hahella chejuensis]ABC26961.1 Flagellar motor protein [Hahella chejuensis KCTC 2396]
MIKPRKQSGGLLPVGAPAWIVTFADLMTLLLTFFILLLSFSSLDAEKYRSIAYSMSKAFGVAWVPSSQGAPDMYPLGGDITPTVPMEPVIRDKGDAEQPAPQSNVEPSLDLSQEVVSEAAYMENDRLASRMISLLENEIEDQAVDIKFDDKGVVLSFTERATFASGSEELKLYMLPVLMKVTDVLADCKGDILVTGHTDDRPIDSVKFRSNWDLSAARAVSVVHRLVLDGRLDASRVSAIGQAETRPLVPNDTDEHRAQNRRVEIHIENAECRLG